MKRTGEHKALYALLGIGAFGTFLGHGMWAVRGKDTFVGLLTGSLKNMFGYHMSAGTGKTLVQAIGSIDLVVAAVMALFIIGALRERGSLYAAAYSKIAIAVFAWGSVWGFLTAFSRVTSAAAFSPAVWDWVERAPNFLLPAALVFVILRHRSIDVPSHVSLESGYTHA